MNNQFKPRQVDAARRHVGGDTHVRAAIAQRGQRIGALLLAKFARQRHNLEATVAHARHQMVHVDAGFTEHDRGFGFVKAQHVENRMLAVTHRHRQRAIFDVDVLLGFALCGNAQRVVLEIFGQFRDFFRHGGREHQRAAGFRRGTQNVFQIFAEPQVQHFVGFVQHSRAQPRQVQRFAVNVVAQTARRADHNMRTAIQRALFAAVIHTTHAGRNLRPGTGIKPFQFACHLQRQFARRRDHQSQRAVGVKQLVLPGQNLVSNGNTEGNGFARTGLRRNQNVTSLGFGGQHGLLHGSQSFIALSRQSRGQRRGNCLINHVFS